MDVQHFIDFEWIKTPSAHEYIESLLHHSKRRHFGLLERPSLPPNKALDTIRYKIFVCGKAGVGKSTTVAKLAGCKIGNIVTETAGLECTIVYWPVRLVSTGQIMFFQLHFWDIGENALKKFDHVLPACKAELDAIIFMFSFTDRSSFTEIPHLINNMVDENDKNPVQVVVGTKTDQYAFSDISESEIESLSESRNIPVLRTKNLTKSTPDGWESINDVAPFLNKLCNLLFYRDFLLANSAQDVLPERQMDG